MPRMLPGGAAPGISALTAPPPAASQRSRPEVLRAAVAFLDAGAQMAADLVEFAVSPIAIPRGRAKGTVRSSTIVAGRRVITSTRSASSTASRMLWVTNKAVLVILLPISSSNSFISSRRDRVERAERLVHQQHVGIVDQGAADRDPLAHAAGQLVRPLVLEAVEPDLLRQVAARRRDNRRADASGLGTETARCRARSSTAAASGPGT